MRNIAAIFNLVCCIRPKLDSVSTVQADTNDLKGAKGFDVKFLLMFLLYFRTYSPS